MKRNVILGALALSLLTCLGTLGIVSRTTSNLRFFAGSLARINPDAPAWEFSRPSQSKEESQLFESFRNLLAEIAQSRTTLRMFVANASHELKTPVAAIHTALEVLLSRKRSAPEFESTCADMLDVAKDMKRLTNALLDLALADRPSEPSLFNTDLSGVVDSVLQRMSAFASERSVILDVRMASDKPVVNGNKELLEIALGNIVENAVKFSPPGTVVHVEMQQPQAGKVRVTVSDQGKGMTESELLQLGVAFFRADKSRSDGASFGLGFAHAKRIVNASGGEIVVTSRPRIGTQVVMEFNVGDGNATSVV